MNSSVFGYLTTLAFVAELVFGAVACAFVQRLLSRAPTPLSEKVGSVRMVLSKLRKGEPMSTDEIDYATQIIAERRSLMAYSIPAAIFTIGCFYVFGSIEQLHGRTPSLRTYIGILPMLGATNLTIQLLRIATLKGRLCAARTPLSRVGSHSNR
jgi:hypothetical protein